MKDITEKIKVSKGTEEAPFEGEISIEEVEEDVLRMIKNGKGQKFAFDDYTHASEDEFIHFCEKIGVPDFGLFLTADESVIKERWCKKNEAEEAPEDAVQEIKANSATNAAKRQALCVHLEKYGERCEIIHQNTDQSHETVVKEIAQKFAPAVLLVNHEKKYLVDSTCANLAMKYNMIYISVYQLIKKHIEMETSYG